MKKSLLTKSGLLAVLCAALFVGQADAVDRGQAAGAMAEINAMSVSAKANLASATANGDIAAIQEAQKRSDAIDAAVAAARDAFAKLELYEKSDVDVAASAEEDLVVALNQAREAFIGDIPEELLKEEAKEQAKQKRAGGGSSGLKDPPNIYQVPWKSKGIQTYYQGLFGEFWNASAFGHGPGIGEIDATPE